MSLAFWGHRDDFVESIESLAARNGIEVPYENVGKFVKEKGPIYEVLAAAAKNFEQNLSDLDDSEQVKNYLINERKYLLRSTKNLI